MIGSRDDPVDRWSRSLAPTYAAPRLVLSHGKGTRVWDHRGKVYLDFLAGIAVTATGHAHPRVAAAISRQARRLVHTSNLYATEVNLDLAAALRAATGLDRAFFCNSGAEANECALKLARRHAVRNKGERNAVVVSFTGSFHGRTLATVALTGQEKHQRDFDPLPAGFVHVPFGDASALEAVFDAHPVAAVFMEPVQGESGVRVPDPAFVRAVRELTRAHDALLVMDEVQTGAGRTGRFLASEWFHVEPDVVTLAKGLASGVPIGACLYREHLAPLMAPGDHGSTFGGNPLASAAALATLHVIEDEHLLANAESRGGELRVALAERVPGLKEVRGLGLLVGAEFEAPIARAVRESAEDAGLLIGNVGEHVLRFAPPLVVTSEDVNHAVGILEKVVLSVRHP